MMEFDTHQQSTRQPEALTVSDTTGSTAADIYILNLGDYPVDGVHYPRIRLHNGPGERCFDSTRFHQRTPITGEERQFVPSILEFEEARYSLGDFSIQSGRLVLSKKAADVVRKLEPDRHQFFPLTVKASKRYREKLEAMGHVLINVCQTAQAVDIEKSNLRASVVTPPPLRDRNILSFW